MINEMFEKGLQIRREVLGTQYTDAALAQADDFSRDFQRLVTEYCCGAGWGREALSRRDRSLLNLAMLGALNRAREFKLHVRGAVDHGCQGPRRSHEGGRCLHARACRRLHSARRVDHGRNRGSRHSVPPGRGLRESTRQRAQRDHTDLRSAIGWRWALPVRQLNAPSRSRFRLAPGEVPRKSKGLITYRTSATRTNLRTVRVAGKHKKIISTKHTEETS